MPWVCSCGQRNIVNGLACLACDRLPEDEMETVEAAPVHPGFRFREDPIDEVVDEAEEPPSPGRRFRFTVAEPEVTELQSRDTGSQDAALGTTSSTTSAGFRFSAPTDDLESVEESVAAVPAIEAPVAAPPSFEEHVGEPASIAAPVAVEPVEENAYPEWPEVDRRAQDRRHQDRRAVDSGINPGELDGRVDSYMPEAADGVEDPWHAMREVIGSSLAPVAPAPDTEPAAQEEDPWEAFRLAREHYEAELSSDEDAPVAAFDDVDEDLFDLPFDDAFETSVPTAYDEPYVAPQDHASAPPVFGEPVFAQPVEEFSVPAFEVDPYEVEAIDDNDSILEEVMRHDENALTDDDFATFPTPWSAEAAEADATFGVPVDEQSTTYDHDWARWEQEQVAPQQPAQDATGWDDDGSDVWSTNAIADAHGDWSSVPQEWVTDEVDWQSPVEQAAPSEVETHADDVWAQQDDPWAANGAEPWEAAETDDDWLAFGSQQPEVSEEIEPWNLLQQPIVEEDPWDATPQPVAQDLWDLPLPEAVDDDPWAVSSPQTAGDVWPGEADPWNGASQEVFDQGVDAGEQPWWAEQANFGSQFGESEDPDLPYLGELDEQDSEEVYGFDDEPAFAQPQSHVSDYFDEAADLDEPDPFEIEDDDWVLPDEHPSATRTARALDREPQRGRAGKGPGKSSSRSGGKKKPLPGRKPATQNSASRGGIRLPFGSGSTVVTVIVIAIAIVALSLLFKDAFQRVGAATNPDGTTAVAATCADSPSQKSSNRDLAAMTLTTLENATLVADHEANTGTVDFSRALAAEPDASTALNVLDQSRFERGYDRSFVLAKGGTLHLSVYQFKGSVCSQEYLRLHPAAGPAFSVNEVAGSVGGISQTGPKAFSGVVRAPVGDTVVVVSSKGVPSADAARSTLQTVLAKQAAALHAAGIQ